MGYIILVLIWAIIWGVVCRAIVINKGYAEEGSKWFWLGFFFSWIAVIVAACKPSVANAGEANVRSTQSSVSGKVTSDGHWTCECGNKNPETVVYCMCGRKRPTLESQSSRRAKGGASQNYSVGYTSAGRMSGEKSAAEQIKEFKSLLDAGIISQEEFDAKKKQLLGI